ncbi:RNA polymerase-associated protein rtf1 [Coniochaeta pulveracea]|uniref:General transcription and DNA repair factor IIH subunit TFB5 n=1 Tax=Coniochaeta pulveracea TaxID=177199 RepID=A0A420YNF7_9PEZI|nr:RNA polymerase-associated protein rtf1 [Coniochaeta pulveracea]
MPRAIRGVLIECEPAIKAIIVMLDRANNNFIVEDLDDTHLVVQESMLTLLKQQLDTELKGTQLPDELLDDSE